MMKGNSKSVPSVLGTQNPGAMPCGKNIPANLVFVLTARLVKGVCAGSMASRNGNANVKPVPYKKVRRGMCFPDMNMTLCLLISIDACGFSDLVLRDFHVAAERFAFHDPQH